MPKGWVHIATLCLALLFCAASTVLGEIRVLVIPKASQSTFWRSVAAGAQAAGKELGLAITYRGPEAEDQHAAQVDIINYGIRKAYHAFVFAPSHVEMATDALKAAAARGIKVVLIDSNMNRKVHDSFIESDNYQAGQTAAHHAAALLGGSGKTVLVRHAENHASTHERCQGFLDTLASRYPMISVIADPYAGLSLGLAYHTVADLLDRLGPIDGIFSVGETASLGTLRALREKGLQGKTKFIGFDYNTTIQEAILSQAMDATIVQNPFQIGYLGVKTAHELIQNKAVPDKIYTKTVLINAENYHTAAVQEIIQANMPPKD